MPLVVDVALDVVCPWCYIGHRRLLNAISRLDAGIDVRVRLRPFELDPGLPKEGVPRPEYHAARFGGEARRQALYRHAAEAGEREGLTLRFDAIRRQPNTLLAHRLLWWAGPSGKQGHLLETMFRGFFERGADLGDESVLAALAGNAGFDAAEARLFLKSDSGTQEVREEESRLRRAGIRAVPCFFIGEAGIISGAEDADVLLGALREAAEITPRTKPG